MVLLFNFKNLINGCIENTLENLSNILIKFNLMTVYYVVIYFQCTIFKRNLFNKFENSLKFSHVKI